MPHGLGVSFRGLVAGLLVASPSRPTDIHPAQLGGSDVRDESPNSLRWSPARRCSVQALAQAWVGDDAVACANADCLLQAQGRRRAAYLRSGDTIHIVQGGGIARVLRMPGSFLRSAPIPAQLGEFSRPSAPRHGTGGGSRTSACPASSSIRSGGAWPALLRRFFGAGMLAIWYRKHAEAPWPRLGPCRQIEIIRTPGRLQ